MEMGQEGVNADDIALKGSTCNVRSAGLNLEATQPMKQELLSIATKLLNNASR